ncbi:MAG TPA: holo-ACP synthase [Candidatus Kapabacteria bacterium]|nr:holo-ACP synthase [Candidatus Kapabacteria bacterium]
MGLMIVGTGVDIVEVQRIKECITKYGEQFLRRIYSKEEIEYCTQKPQHQQHLYYAVRFAAKEAFAKALGTGIGKIIAFKDIVIAKDEKGKPSITIVNRNGHELVKDSVIHCSLSHTHQYAIATVIIERHTM